MSESGIGELTGPGILSGKGSPEGVYSGQIGTLYRRTDGFANATLYVKESGAGNTGWKPIGAVATRFRKGYISGLNTSLWSADASKYAQVAAGECRDSTNTVDAILTNQLTKDTSVAWAPGNYSGGIDVVAALTNTTYHIFVIRNPTTLTVECLVSLSPTAPTLPSGYTTFRRVGSYMRVGGTGVKYFQDGNYFWRDNPERDLDGISVPLTAMGTYFTLTRVPKGIRGIVIYDALHNTSAAGGGIWASSPYIAGTGTSSPFGPYVNIINQYESTHAQVEFDDVPKIRIHTTVASGTVNFWNTVFGWIDFRGQNDPLIS
jgi:hypothetical protein